MGVSLRSRDELHGFRLKFIKAGHSEIIGTDYELRMTNQTRWVIRHRKYHDTLLVGYSKAHAMRLLAQLSVQLSLARMRAPVAKDNANDQR